MLAAVDVLRAVEERGAVSLDELDAAIPASPADGFWVALDAAIDHGMLRFTGNKNGLAGGYRLTQRGRRALDAAASGTAAA
ncbi:MAG: hypothetical protein ACYC2H_00175 [Thermoplasmatota archaeon]